MFAKTKEEIAEEEEERRLQLEKQKEEKLLKALRAEEERKYNLRKEKLDRELAYEKSGHDMIKKTYDTVGYHIKWPLVQAKARHIWGCFEILNEWKDRQIHLLEDDIKGRDLRAELLRTMNLELIDKLIKCHERNMNTLFQDFEVKKNKMLANRYAFLQNALLKGNQVRDEVRISAYGIDKAIGEEIQRVIQKNGFILGNYKEMCRRNFQEIFSNYEKTIVDKWLEYKKIFEKYKKDAFKLQMAIYVEKNKLKKESELMEKMKQEGRKCERQIKFYLNAGSEGPADRRLKELDAVQFNLELCLTKLRDEQKAAIKKDKEQLSNLSRISNETMDKLKKIKELLDSILKIHSITYKRETAEEQVFCPEYEQLPQTIFNENMDAASACDKLVYRTSRVKGQSDFIKAKIDVFEKENDDLKRKLKMVISKLIPQKDIRVIMQGIDSNLKELQ